MSEPAAPEASRQATVSQAGEQRYAYIESLRALGSIMVVFAHVGAVTFALKPGIPGAGSPGDLFARGVYGAGITAVYLFFALSGFILYLPFARRDFGGGSRVDIRKYAVNRALRILPLYYVAVVVLLIVEFDVPKLRVWARFLTFTENFSTHTVFQYIGPAWSLVVELHFYLLLPLLAWALARLANGSRKRAILILGGLALASFAVRLTTVYLADVPSLLWRASLPANGLFILAGMITAIVYLALEDNRPRWLRGPLLNSDLWLLLWIPVWAIVAFGAYRYDALVCLSSFAIIGAAAFPHLRRGPVTRVLWWRPLAHLGVASYSLYIWHLPILIFLIKHGVDQSFVPLAVVGLPLAIGVALLSYRVVEEPFLRMRRRWSRAAPPQAQEDGAAAATIAGPP